MQISEQNFELKFKNSPLFIPNFWFCLFAVKLLMSGFKLILQITILYIDLCLFLIHFIAENAGSQMYVLAK
jgi:hypothetical protein